MLLRGLAEPGYFDHDGRTGLYAPNVRIGLATAWMQEHLYSEHNLLRLMDEGSRADWPHGDDRQPPRRARALSARIAGHSRRALHAKIGSLRPLFRSAAGKVLLTTLPEREISVLLRKANVLEVDAGNFLEFCAVRREVHAVRQQGYVISMGTSMAGAAALAVLIPVARDREPMTLSVGGPMTELQHDRNRLAQVHMDAVEPIRRALL